MIQIFSPLRVDLCGGTLDCWPLYLLLPEAKTINFGIDLGTQVRLEPGSGPEIDFHLKDLSYEKSFASLAEVLKSADKELALLKPLLRYFAPEEGFALTLSSSSPVGGGLGGSSSLLVGLCKAFLQWQGQQRSPEELVRLACNLETRILRKPAGTQDYIPALEGGLNVITYSDDGPKWVTSTDVAGDFNERFFLVDTGRPHHSGLNNWDVIQRALEGDSKVLRALEGLGELSLEFERELSAGNYDGLQPLLLKELELRLQLSSSFTSPEIEKLNRLLAPGAALKICGAGGGGCVMVWAQPEQLSLAKKAVEAEGFNTLTTKFWARSHEKS